jgi:uncharacterized membrane protein YphA (DoxX/SURF4 family)
MKWLDNIVRLLVGGLFIFSGLVKLNDPMGTEIKLGEYFEVFATDFTHFFELLVPVAMPIGLFLVILEIILGTAVLLNFKMKWTTYALGLLIVFFTFLTFYSAYFNKVTDCGCFGDAIPLTPWESFAKDIILVILIGYLFWRRDYLQPWLSAKTNIITLSATLLISLFLGIYAIRHLPFIDFRPYAVGDNLPANMRPPEQAVFVYTFEKAGKEITSEKYLSAEEGYTYLGHKITNEEKTIAKITDYNIWNEDLGDYTAQSFVGNKLFLIVYDTRYAENSPMPEISSLIKSLNHEVEAIVLTSSAGPDIKRWLAEYQLNIPYFYTDATVLKAMIRSSPGIMLLKDGTVLGKWHYNDIPAAGQVKKLLGTAM